MTSPCRPRPRSSATYLVLLLGNTLAASLIWGINTIFLLDAGLSNLEAFAANAFFTAGMVLFEVPTGIVADTVGRRASYLLGTLTLAASTLLYVLLWQIEAPFWAWAVVVDPARARVHVLLRRGRGVARRRAHGDRASPASSSRCSARGQVVSGVGDAHRLGRRRVHRRSRSSLGVPFVLRGVVLVVMFARRVPADARRRLHAGEGRPAARPRCARSRPRRSSTAGACPRSSG